MLDLQPIRRDASFQLEAVRLRDQTASHLFIGADAATAAVDDLVCVGVLIEEAIDDHDVREHYDDELAEVAAYATKRRHLPSTNWPGLCARTPVCSR